MGNLCKVFLMAVSLLVMVAAGGCGERKAEKNLPSETVVAEAVRNSRKDSAEVRKDTKGKTLVVYVTQSDVRKTEQAAKEIQQETGADIFEIELVHPYPKSNALISVRVLIEKFFSINPELKNRVENIDEYDTILIGYPVWFSDAPKAIYSFIDGHNLKGKKAAVFVTSGSTPAEKTLPKLKKALEAAGARVVDRSLRWDKTGDAAVWLKNAGLK